MLACLSLSFPSESLKLCLTHMYIIFSQPHTSHEGRNCCCGKLINEKVSLHKMLAYPLCMIYLAHQNSIKRKLKKYLLQQYYFPL